MLRLFTKQPVRQGLLISFLVIICGPYLYSRLVAYFRGAIVHSVTPQKVTHAASEKIAESSTKAEFKETTRIAAYNIAHGRGLTTSNWTGESPKERLARLNEIAKLLRQIDADIVVLNEVDFDCSWSHHVDQARYLAKQAGYNHYATEHNLDFRLIGWTWRFGNAVLSKYPITNVSVVDLPHYALWEETLAGKKRALRCEVQAEQNSLAIIATHLSHRSEAIRVRSSQMLLNEVDASKLPTIIAGDFNSAPPTFPKSSKDASGNNAIELLDKCKRLRRLPSGLPIESGFTYPSKKPAQLIDWFFVPNDCDVVDYQVTSSLLSDHKPICTEIALPPAGE